MKGSPFKYFAYGCAATEVEVDGFTGAYHTRRVDIVHDVGDSLSPLVDIGQIEGGFVQGAGWLTLEDLRWDESDGPNRGRLTTQAASTYKLPSFSELPDEFNVTLLERAHEEGAVYGSKAVGEPPLMLAFSVREALRQAAAAFGPEGTSVDLASPATPEAVWWALTEAAKGHEHGHVIDGVDGAHPEPSDPTVPDRHPESEVRQYTAHGVPTLDQGMTGMDWLSAVEHLRSRREAGVLVTLASVRGHSPRAAGAKMVVSAQETWGSIGGGNLEAVAVDAGPRPARRARGRTDDVHREPVGQGAGRARRAVLRWRGDRAARPAARPASGSHLRRRARRAGAGPHPGAARSRPAPDRLQAASSSPIEALAPLADATARIHTHHVPVLPELVLGELPAGTHVLVMTHDHAEDAALIDAALRTDHLASIGLIGSSAKWTRFRKKLLGDGHEPDALERVTTPIGLPELTGKDPATIAVGIAAALLLAFEREAAAARGHQTGSIEQSGSIEPGSIEQSGAVVAAEPIDERR